MSFIPTSIQILAHASGVAGAPALFTGVSRFSQTIVRPIGQSRESDEFNQSLFWSLLVPMFGFLLQSFLTGLLRE